jgi:hypothetical protein
MEMKWNAKMGCYVCAFGCRAMKAGVICPHSPAYFKLAKERIERRALIRHAFGKALREMLTDPLRDEDVRTLRSGERFVMAGHLGVQRPADFFQSHQHRN